MSDIDRPFQLSIEIVYVDEHLIQIEAIVDTRTWRGQARAYTMPANIAALAIALDGFVADPDDAAEFVVGEDNGIGLIALRFYRIDRAGHLACHVRLASDCVPTRPEQISTLAIEVGVEAQDLARFARQLAEMARVSSGRAYVAIDANS